MSKVSLYKNKSLNLQEDVDQKQLRLHRKSIHQKEARENLVNERRGLKGNEKEETTACTSNNVTLSKRQQSLQKWKEDKLLKKKLEAEKKKPVFKVSSNIGYTAPAILKNQKSEKVLDKPGIVTRRMAKALITAQKLPSVTNANSKHNENAIEGMAKTSRHQFKVPKLSSKPKPLATHNVLKPVSTSASTATNDVQESEEQQMNASKQSRKSFAPDNFQFVAPGNLSTYAFTPICNTAVDPDKDSLVNNMERFKLKSQGNQVLPSTKVRENKTHSTPLCLVKNKVFNDSSIFSPVADNESADSEKDNIPIVNTERFKLKSQGSKDMPSTQIGENSTHNTPLSLVKTKVFDNSSIFSPVADNEFDSTSAVVEEHRLYEIQAADNCRIAKLSERQSFLQQMPTRENFTVATSIFSPLKADVNKFSATVGEKDLISLSSAHRLANKENN